MSNYVVSDSSLTSIANAIRAKGQTEDLLTYPDGFVSAIQSIPTGGGGGATGDVIFLDYDGSVVAAKTKEEINAMTSDTELPANPTHTGLTAQGWNWTVAQLKTQLTAMPDQKVYVGQMYVTQSGKTEIDVEMQEGRLSPILTICVKGTVEVDWGDNTTPDTVTGTSESTRLAVGPHNYASAGDYTIKISVTSGSFAFYCGSNSYALLRKNTTANENKVYANCVKKIRLGTGISSIGTYAFYTCYSLASVTIPSSVTSIGNYAFSYCNSLTSITIPSNLTSIGNSVFSNCYSLASITIPNSVTSIEGSAFSSCYSLANITIPSSVTSIGNSVFTSCYSLANITIPSGVTSISSYLFNYCYKLASITIPSSVTSIGTQAFYQCQSLVNITIPSSLTSIGASAFYYCYSIKSINIPSRVTSIGTQVFYGCSSLESVTIENGVTSINQQMFANCENLANVTIPSSVTSIGQSAFNTCKSLTSITIPNSVTSIGDYAFSNCLSLANINIPSSVMSIGQQAFYACNCINSITIQSDVTSIGNNAFQNCYGVSEYHILPTTVPTAGTTIFDSIVSDCVIYVPRSENQTVLNAYKTASNWSTYASYMQEEPA